MTTRTNTTAADVRLILPESISVTDASLNKAIEAAICIINRIAEDCAKGLSAGCLTLAETYLAAHLVTLAEGVGGILSEKDCCGGEIKYGIKYGSGVLATSYGQMANTLVGGCLVAVEDEDAAVAKRTSGVAFMAVGAI